MTNIFTKQKNKVFYKDDKISCPFFATTEQDKIQVSLRVCIIFRIFVENQNMQVYGKRNQ